MLNGWALRSVRTNGSTTLLDLGGGHVRGGNRGRRRHGIDLGQQGTRSPRLHHAVTRKPEVDHGTIEPSAPVAVWTMPGREGTAALGDRGPVEDDRFAMVCCPGRQAGRLLRSCGIPSIERGDAVVEGQVEKVLARRPSGSPLASVKTELARTAAG